ncbi:hypothetical protein I553_4068, partial [Mycobacterium xenopi 4042]
MRWSIAQRWAAQRGGQCHDQQGQVTPTNATLQAKVGAPITFDVTSDAADELHVHSVPDHKFAVAAGRTKSSYSSRRPGQCRGRAASSGPHHRHHPSAPVTAASAADVLAHGLAARVICRCPTPMRWSVRPALTFTFALVAFA